MGEEKQVDCLVHRLQVYFAVAVARQQKTVVARDDQRTQSASGSLDAQFFEQRHTQGVEDQVGASYALQLNGRLLHDRGQLFCRLFVVLLVIHLVQSEFLLLCLSASYAICKGLSCAL